MKDGVRDSYRQVLQTLESLNLETLNKSNLLASHEPELHTVTVMRNRKFFPFIIPRILEWTEVETGITQRLRALNLFFRDIYEQLIKKVSFQH
jgi:uncharacterized circularly permuted ATP-grasp superfamily protein